MGVLVSLARGNVLTAFMQGHRLFDLAYCFARCNGQRLGRNPDNGKASQLGADVVDFVVGGSHWVSRSIIYLLVQR